MEFDGTPVAYRQLREAIKTLLESDLKDLSLTKLYKLAYDEQKDNEKKSKLPIPGHEILRSQLYKFKRGDQKTIPIDVATLIFDFIKLKYSQYLNIKAASLGLISHNMDGFYHSDEKYRNENIKEYLSGRYKVFRQAWSPRIKDIAVGEIIIDIRLIDGVSVMHVSTEFSSRESVDLGRREDSEIMDGFAISIPENIAFFLKGLDGSMMIATLYNWNPQIGSKMKCLKFSGTMYPCIGKGPHFAYIFHARKVSPREEIDICTMKPNKEIVREMGAEFCWHGLEKYQDQDGS